MQRGGKVSFTHLIGYAVVRALGRMPVMNSSYTTVDGKPRRRPPRARQPRPRRRRRARPTARTPAGAQHQGGRHARLRRLLRRLRGRHPQGPGRQDLRRRLRRHHRHPHQPGHDRHRPVGPPADAGPGRHHRRRHDRLPGRVPGRRPRTIARLGVSKVVTLTSTYDHRIIQGAESGSSSSHVHELLLGDDGFYDEVFRSLDVPYEPVPVAGRQQPRARLGGRGRQAGPGADADQHVPGARPPDRRPRPARRGRAPSRRSSSIPPTTA